MHPECLDFVKGVLKSHAVAGKRVLEFGSYDVNGSIRDLFGEAAEYVGVDHRKGPGVDVVSLFHEYASAEPFDIFLCLNTFEHDPYWRGSLRNGLRLLKSGGLFVLTVPHGYVEHEMECPPEAGYYRNIDPARLHEMLPPPFHWDVKREPPETHAAGLKP